MAPASGHDDGVANHNVVFIDTSLDTHLAMIVTDSDTVSDFKRKIMLEHRQLFPTIGDVKVESLKVKQRGSFYHLSDSMPVKSAFDDAKRNWFVSVDASRLEQNDGTSQHTVNHKAGDQLALPWVTHSRSNERHDNHGSPSVHSKTAPLVNQKTLNVYQLTSGDSCKDVSKNVDEDKLCNDKQLDSELQEKLDTVNTDMNLKKRTRDVHNKSSPKDGLGHGPSVKKKRKTRGKGDVKVLEENLALAHDNDKVNDKGENMFEHKTEGKDLRDENNRINEGENCSAIDQVATDVFTTEGVGSETVGDVAMVVENNIQQEMTIEMSQKEKDSELVQKTVVENEIHSSLMRTPDCEHDTAEVAVAGHMKRSAKHKAAEKEVSSTTSIIKKLHDTNKDATESSPQQDVGSNSQERADDQIDKHKDDSEMSLKQKPELKLPKRKKRATGSENIDEGKRRRTKKVFKHADNLVDDISSTVLALVVDERKINEVSEKSLTEAKKGDDVVMKEMEVSVENMEEKSRKEFTDTNVVLTVTKEDNLIRHSESLMNNDADTSITEKNTSQVNAQGVLDNLEKQNEKKDDTTKKKKKKKTKKSSGRNEDMSVTKHVEGDIIENVDRKDGDEVKEKDAQNKLQDLPSKHQSTEVEIESKKSQSVDHHNLPDKTLKDVTESELSKVNNEVDNPEVGSRELDCMDHFAPGHQLKKIASTDNWKVMKKTKDDSRNDQSQKLVSKNENDKVSVDVFKDPNMTNIDKTKTPKRTKKIDAQKTNRQQPNSVQTRVKPVEKKSLNHSQKGKSLLNTPGTIFGSDGDDDDATVKLDSSTHAPSRKSSSSSSSSGDSVPLYSIRTHARKGNEGAVKNNINSQSKLKNTSIGNLLRSSSAFKKAKVTASSRVEDTESQPVDFVPDNQP